MVARAGVEPATFRLSGAVRCWERPGQRTAGSPLACEEDDGRPDRRHVECNAQAEVINAVHEFDNQRDAGTVRMAVGAWTGREVADHRSLCRRRPPRRSVHCSGAARATRRERARKGRLRRRTTMARTALRSGPAAGGGDEIRTREGLPSTRFPTVRPAVRGWGVGVLTCGGAARPPDFERCWTGVNATRTATSADRVRPGQARPEPASGCVAHRRPPPGGAFSRT